MSDIFKASEFGDVSRIKELLQSGINVNSQDEDKDTPLICAAEYNQLEVARLLYEDYQADLNIRGQVGGTAIWRAARNGHDRMVASLTGWGADLESRGPRGGTAISRAAYMGNSTTGTVFVKSDTLKFQKKNWAHF